jgi:hypothetical protein
MPMSRGCQNKRDIEAPDINCEQVNGIPLKRVWSICLYLLGGIGDMALSGIDKSWFSFFIQYTEYVL